VSVTGALIWRCPAPLPPGNRTSRPTLFGRPLSRVLLGVCKWDDVDLAGGFYGDKVSPGSQNQAVKGRWDAGGLGDDDRPPVPIVDEPVAGSRHLNVVDGERVGAGVAMAERCRACARGSQNAIATVSTGRRGHGRPVWCLGGTVAGIPARHS
jgi:hypothetical protein